MLEKLEQIDEILASFEDWMHGEDGNKCTYARKLIIELKASDNAKLPVSGSLSEEECKCIRYVGGTKWYSNGCKVHPDNDG